MAKVYYRWYGHAKMLLYRYPRSKQEVRRREHDIIFGKQQFLDGIGSRQGLGDPTQRKAAELSSGRYQEMCREVQAVDRLLDYLTESGQKDLLRYIDMAFFRCSNTEAGAAVKLGRSAQVTKRWNRLILKYLAVQMGWEDE